MCSNEAFVLPYFRLVTGYQGPSPFERRRADDYSTVGNNRRHECSGYENTPIISYALVHNDVVSLCGIPGDPVGDVKVQTRQVLERIDQLLQMAGTDKSKLLVAQVWLADMSDFDDHNTVWNDWVDRQNPPVRACVGAPLWRSGVRVEIMVTAAK